MQNLSKTVSEFDFIVVENMKLVCVVFVILFVLNLHNRNKYEELKNPDRRVHRFFFQRGQDFA